MPGSRADGSVPTATERGRARAVLNRLKARYPTIGTALDYESPWQLLVTTVLSAQTTDDNVNKVRGALFARYPEPADLAAADIEDVERIVYSTGFYRQKAKSIVTLAGDVVEKFGGEVPRNLADLTTLRGVGRKTASVVLAEAWGEAAIAVDTHVRRVTNRIGLTSESDPVKIEFDLKALYPTSDWAGVSMRFIQFGRDICDARKPLCSECDLVALCSWPDKRL
ncbi:MAG: endonuclease III [Acidimicrobiia bacterium]